EPANGKGTASHVGPRVRYERASQSGDWELIPQPQLLQELVVADIIGDSGVVVRGELLPQLGPFDESLDSSANLDFWFRLAHNGGAMYRRSAAYFHHENAARRAMLPPAAGARDQVKVLVREKDRPHDRTARRELNRRIADAFANLGADARHRRKRLR